jgi:hypothetical protein
MPPESGSTAALINAMGAFVVAHPISLSILGGFALGMGVSYKLNKRKAEKQAQQANQANAEMVAAS